MSRKDQTQLTPSSISPSHQTKDRQTLPNTRDRKRVKKKLKKKENAVLWRIVSRFCSSTLKKCQRGVRNWTKFSFLLSNIL
ncbi:hypothetical protein K2173_025560 [Erythroxylum novogranatense]|uniref:Uncharacterized protein n=1 Tax=Erythroxylum novogranatense TaxID=1862640 RepID=A0AAV8TA67_9ROSI|nr:hypothetical protein K2173_025560 [Erythroxylum novogranatense]